MKGAILVFVAVLVLLGVALACNNTLCEQKGGELQLSLLNVTGYACVAPDGTQLVIP